MEHCNSLLCQETSLKYVSIPAQALHAWHADEVAKSNPPTAARQSSLPGAGSSARSPAKRPKPSQGQQLQSPSKRRQLDTSARNTRSRAAQQSAAPPAARSAARDLVSDSEEDNFVVHLSDDDSSDSEEEHACAAQPGPSQRPATAAGMCPYPPRLPVPLAAKQPVQAACQGMRGVTAS